MLFAAGCAGRREAEEPVTFSIEQPTRAVVTVPSGEPVEPGVWSGDGLSLTLPDGWSAETGPPESTLVLRAEEPVTGTTVELWRFPVSGRPTARPRPDCDTLLDDPGLYRAVPLLGPSASHSCTLEDGAFVQGWYGIAAGAEVHVEALYPPGRATEGRRLIDPFLRSITTSARQ